MKTYAQEFYYNWNKSIEESRGEADKKIINKQTL